MIVFVSLSTTMGILKNPSDSISALRRCKWMGLFLMIVQLVDMYECELRLEAAYVRRLLHDADVGAQTHPSYKGVLRYFEPESGSTATSVFPFPSSLAF